MAKYRGVPLTAGVQVVVRAVKSLYNRLTKACSIIFQFGPSILSGASVKAAICCWLSC